MPSASKRQRRMCSTRRSIQIGIAILPRRTRADEGIPEPARRSDLFILDGFGEKASVLSLQMQSYIYPNLFQGYPIG